MKNTYKCSQCIRKCTLIVSHEMDIKIPPCCPFNTLGFQSATITWKDIVPKKVKVLGNKIDQMFLESNKLNKRSLALWKKSLKLRKKASLLLTNLTLNKKKHKKE